MVEQGTHKPLVGSSNLPPGTLLKWLGFTFCTAQVVAITCVNLDTRFAQHLRGHTATTKRLGTKLAIVAKKRSSGIGRGAENRTSTETQKESRPRHLLFATVEQPRKLSGLVGSSNFPPGTLLNGLGLHSASVERLPLHWILHGSRRKIRSGSSWSYSNNRAPRSETCDRGKKRSSGVGRGAANANEH